MNYLWRIPKDCPDEIIGEYQRERSPDRFAFLRGEKLDAEITTPSFDFDASVAMLASYDVLPNSTNIPLVSFAIAEWLRANCPQDVQLLPAVINAADKQLNGYHLLNILNLVSGVDQTRSSSLFVPGTKQIMKFNRLRLVPGCLVNHHVVRLAEYPPFILVSDVVRKQFDAVGWKGASFVLPEAIHP